MRMKTGIMNTHDPREHIRGIHQILISDKKRIGFLFGAGTSLATGLPYCTVPAIEKMTQIIVDKVEGARPEFKSAIMEFREEAKLLEEDFNIETLLSRVEAKRAVIGQGTLNGLKLDDFIELATLLKTEVIKLVSVHDKLKPADRKKLAHARFAEWARKAERRHPAEIFTINYDYLLEIALEAAEIPYFDGFSGSFEPFFCPGAVEDMEAYPRLLKLWKLHGSLGWKAGTSDRSVVRQQGTSADSILIYPSHLKYNESKRQPYVGLIDRLCAFLQQDDAVLFTCGYSFGDSHINERIETSLRRGANAHVFAMYYDESESGGGENVYGLADETNRVRVLAADKTGGKMSVYGRRHAIIGGKFGTWRIRDEPKPMESLRVSQYFDEDAAIPSNETGLHQGNEVWNGTGRFLLPDFRRFTEFLSDLSTFASPKGA